MTNAEKKRLAKSLYIKSGQNKKQIATQVSVTEKTLRNWAEIGDWEELKNASTITRSELLKASYRQLKAINEKIEDDHNGIPTKELSDAKGVIRKEIEALSEMPLHQYISVATEFTEHLSKNNPRALIGTVELLNDFIELIASR